MSSPKTLHASLQAPFAHRNTAQILCRSGFHHDEVLRYCFQDVVRPLGIDERTAVLAAAVSIDFDYFSQHSHSGGGMFPFLMPMPTPSYPPEAGPDAEGACHRSA